MVVAQKRISKQQEGKYNYVGFKSVTFYLSSLISCYYYINE